MLKNEKEKFFISVIVVLLIIGFLIWRGIVNVNAEINDKINELKDKKVSINVYSLKENLSEKEREEYDFSKDKIEKINNHFVYASNNDDADFTVFFGQLDSIATQTTQKEKSLSIELYQKKPIAPNDKKKSDGSNNSVPTKEEIENSRLLKLTLESNFEDLIKFISYLEELPYYIYIESVSVNMDNSAGIREKTKKDISADSSVDLQTVLIIKVFRKTNIL